MMTQDPALVRINTVRENSFRNNIAVRGREKKKKKKEIKQNEKKKPM